MPASPDFLAFLDELAAVARSAPDVRGLVAFGSTADRSRADTGSDHDFAWITTDHAAAERYRHDLAWLPRAERILVSTVEHHGGVKVIYDDGHRLEFGIADAAAFATWAGAPAEVIVGDAEVHAAAAAVVASTPEGAPDPHRELRLMLTQLLSGIGRANRGELLSASRLVRYEAVDHLLRAIAAVQPHPRLDPLDPRRRFEQAHPSVGAAVDQAATLPIGPAVLSLLDIAGATLGGHPAYPTAAVALVRAAARSHPARD